MLSLDLQCREPCWCEIPLASSGATHLTSAEDLHCNNSPKALTQIRSLIQVYLEYKEAEISSVIRLDMTLPLLLGISVMD